MGIESCNFVLTGDIFNKEIFQTTQESRYVSTQAFLMMSEDQAWDAYQKWRQKNGGETLNIGARFPFDGFPVGVKINGRGTRKYTESEFRGQYREWKELISSRLEQEGDSSFSAIYASFIRDPHTIDGWRFCIDRVSSLENAQIYGYGFRDESGNPFIRIEWNPGPNLVFDKSLLTLDPLGEGVEIGGLYRPDLRLANGDILFPVITDSEDGFAVLANIRVLDNESDMLKRQFAPKTIAIPPKRVPDEIVVEVEPIVEPPEPIVEPIVEPPEPIVEPIVEPPDNAATGLWAPTGGGRDVADGWAIGNNPVGGGNFDIYRLNGTRWDKMPGGAVRIGGTREAPFIVNAANEIFVWRG